jgi:hypothetical protein
MCFTIKRTKDPAKIGNNMSISLLESHSEF